MWSRPSHCKTLYVVVTPYTVVTPSSPTAPTGGHQASEGVHFELRYLRQPGQAGVCVGGVYGCGVGARGSMH